MQKIEFMSYREYDRYMRTKSRMRQRNAENRRLNTALNVCYSKGNLGKIGIINDEIHPIRVNRKHNSDRYTFVKKQCAKSVRKKVISNGNHYRKVAEYAYNVY